MGRVLLSATAASCALIAAAAASAEPVTVKDGKFEAVVSASQESRITIPGDKIATVRKLDDPDGPQVLVETDSATGDAYVAFDGDPKGRKESIFLITASGRTIQAVLKPADVEAQTITVQLPGPAGADDALTTRADHRAPYQEIVTALIRLMFNGETPDGVRHRYTGAAAHDVGPYEVRVSDTYEVSGLKGTVLVVRNLNKTDVPVSREQFIVKGVLAAAVDHEVLRPGESGRVFIVEEGQ